MRKALALFLVLVMFAGCSSTTVAKDFNGLGTPAGKAVHVSTSNIALHFLMGKQPIAGDASLEKTVGSPRMLGMMQNVQKLSQPS